MARGVLFGHNNLLPLIPLDYQPNYAAHHLYPSFLLITGIRRNRAPAKYDSRTSEKITLTLALYYLSRASGQQQTFTDQYHYHDFNNIVSELHIVVHDWWHRSKTRRYLQQQQSAHYSKLG